MKFTESTTPTLDSLIRSQKRSVLVSSVPKSLKYWTKTLAKLLLTMFLITWSVFTIVFILVSLIPGDPKIINDLIAAKADQGTIESMRELFFLNDGFFVKYFKAFGSMFDGTFGMSGTYGVSASIILIPKVLLSFQIGFIAIAFSILLGVPVGMALAKRKGAISDIISGGVAIIAFAIPAFVVGIIFMFISYVLDLPIIFEYGNWFTLLLPAIVIAIPVGLTYSRYLRSSIREEYRKQYVALARVKGVSERRLMWSHILKSSLYPVVTYFPIVVTMALFGSITVETVFSIPGSGDLMVSSALEKDQSMLLALSTVYTMSIVVSFFIRDLLIQFIDPRVRVE